MLAVSVLWSAIEASETSTEGEVASSSSVPSSAKAEVISTEPLELALLSNLPKELHRILNALNLQNARLLIFLDFDDTVARREYTVEDEAGATYQFKYLSSPEIFRMLKSVMDSIIQGREGSNDTYAQLANAAISHASNVLFTEQGLSYHYPEEITFKESTLEPLRQMNAVVKICSGLPLKAGKKQAFIESLGLTTDDYIYAGDKAMSITQYVAADYEAQKKIGNDAVNPRYAVVLVDNLRGVSHLSSVDNFLTQIFKNSHPLRKQGLNVIPFAVYSSRFMTDVEKNKDQIAKEIEMAINLYEARKS